MRKPSWTIFRIDIAVTIFDTYAILYFVFLFVDLNLVKSWYPKKHYDNNCLLQVNSKDMPIS